MHQTVEFEAPKPRKGPQDDVPGHQISLLSTVSTAAAGRARGYPWVSKNRKNRFFQNITKCHQMAQNDVECTKPLNLRPQSRVSAPKMMFRDTRSPFSVLLVRLRLAGQGSALWCPKIEKIIFSKTSPNATKWSKTVWNGPKS